MENLTCLNSSVRPAPHHKIHATSTQPKGPRQNPRDIHAAKGAKDFNIERGHETLIPRANPAGHETINPTGSPSSDTPKSRVPIPQLFVPVRVCVNFYSFNIERGHVTLGQ